MTSHLRAVLISLLVAVATTAAVVVIAYLSFPVTGIRVEGATMYPESDAWDAVSQHASLLTLNEERLERRVEANPWVEGAEVLEDNESGIVTVKVEERRPVLDAEVEGERRTLALDGGELPGLGGTGLARVELDEDQVGDVLRVGRVLREGGLHMESVDAAGPGGIAATVEGRRVVFAEEVTEDQAQALGDVMGRWREGAVFDLRSPGRVVVTADAEVGDGTGSL
ncbi:MAG TPA: FtsQ-type POTRA domain-containing protein [Rubrobacteraceae bacterium]|nr:FtsQ-type POTRA domain-containing protein [Rubrobacteraceae bacterium]